MARVIAISGPQGGGKSTLLNGLKNDKIWVDDFKVSRAIQEKYSASALTDMTSDPEIMMRFQKDILYAKFDRDCMNRERTASQFEPIILTERSFADIFVYANLWAFKLFEKGSWTVEDSFEFMTEFSTLCIEMQAIYDSVIYIPPMSHIEWENDPHRASKDDVDIFTEEIETFFYKLQPRDVSVFRITEASVPNRIYQAQRWIFSTT